MKKQESHTKEQELKYKAEVQPLIAGEFPTNEKEVFTAAREVQERGEDV